MIIPGEDGISHINIYSKGNTLLGRMLSNFAYTPFQCDDGKFYSIEGYWYWLGCKDDRLRYVWGIRAKNMGKSIPKLYHHDDFERKIKKAIICKIEQNKNIIYLLKSSSLPFCHYYVFKNGYKKDAGHEWLVKFISKIRDKIKEKV